MPKEGKARVLTEDEFKRLLVIAKDAQMPERNAAGIGDQVWPEYTILMY